MVNYLDQSSSERPVLSQWEQWKEDVYTQCAMGSQPHTLPDPVIPWLDFAMNFFFLPSLHLPLDFSFFPFEFHVLKVLGHRPWMGPMGAPCSCVLSPALLFLCYLISVTAKGLSV